MKNNQLLRGILKGAVYAFAFAALAFAGLAAEKADKPKPYPLNTCAVSGEKLGQMGHPYVFVHHGREIKLCCKGCLKDFNKEPAKYIKKLEAAEKSGKAPEKPNDPAPDHGHKH